MNTGNMNTGDMNAGNMNTGNRNAGDMNTGNRNTGIFNTDEPKMRAFNKISEITFTEFNKKYGSPSIIPLLTEWIETSQMTSDDKNRNPSHTVIGGFLKKYEYKEAWGIAWKKATEKDRLWFLNLPNFDADIFMEITGIDVRQNSQKTELLKKADELIAKANELRNEAEKMQCSQ
jgi:hypothetical protein